MEKANVFNIERYATEDGKGIRTVIFMKGCAMKCKWCANPESQLFQREIILNKRLCRECGKCAIGCPNQAITWEENFGYITDSKKCSGCMKCVEECFYDARSVAGTEYTKKELYDLVMKDYEYYKMSNGGITFSGGEPLFQSKFIQDFAKQLRMEGITVLIETCGQVALENIQDIIEVVDYIYYDIKHIDEDRHRELTGCSNSLIKSNLEWLCSHYQGELSVRYPYIPGCNDDIKDIHKFLSYISSLPNIHEVVFLPYHRLGLPKYNGLGRTYEMGDMISMKTVELMFLQDFSDQYKLNIRAQ
jgi:pyruvate formate lyase activating enzyme